MKPKKWTHRVTTLRREFDGTPYARRCSCGGAWKIYQKPYHYTRAQAAAHKKGMAEFVRQAQALRHPRTEEKP